MRLNLHQSERGLPASALIRSAIAAAVLLLLGFAAGQRTLLGVLAGLLLVSLAGLLMAYRRLGALQESVRKLSLIADMNVQVNQEILLNEDIELIYSTILNYLFNLFDAASTGSVLVLGEDGYLRFAASRGFTEEFISKFHLKLEDSFLYQATGGAIKDAQLITGENMRHIRTVFEPGAWKYQCVISAPLFVGDRLFGLLNLDSPVSGTYSLQDVEIVERFRTQIEIGLLARERYRVGIKRYQVDALTGVLTRRYFDDLFKLSLDRALRHKESFVLALFDVDDLKLANDNLGHLAGDQLLLQVANALRQSCRNSDIIGRFGGDEFIAVYPLTDAKAIEKSIASNRTKLRSKTVLVGNAEYRASFSYGLAVFPQDGTDRDALIAAADRRLYAMKSAEK